MKMMMVNMMVMIKMMMSAGNLKRVVLTVVEEGRDERLLLLEKQAQCKGYHWHAFRHKSDNRHHQIMVQFIKNANKCSVHYKY